MTVVLTHQLEKDSGVYRIVVGDPITDEVPMTDAEGQTLLDDDDQPLTETVVVGHENVEDFVFAADDSRVRGKAPEQVAAFQRKAVRDALAARAVPRAKAKPPAATELPGVGEPL